jgi:hypothetical protein
MPSEIRHIIDFVLDVFNQIKEHEEFRVPCRTVAVDGQSQLHTMEVLVKDVPFPLTFQHLLVFTHPDINRVKLDSKHSPPRYLVYGKPYAVNRALTGRVLMQVYASILDLIRFYLAGTGPVSTIEKSEVIPIHVSRQLDIIIEQVNRLQAQVAQLSAASKRTETVKPSVAIPSVAGAEVQSSDEDPLIVVDAADIPLAAELNVTTSQRKRHHSSHPETLPETTVPVIRPVKATKLQIFHLFLVWSFLICS